MSNNKAGGMVSVLISLLTVVTLIAIKGCVQSNHDMIRNFASGQYQKINDLNNARKIMSDNFSKDEIDKIIKGDTRKLKDAATIYGYVELAPARLKEFCAEANYVPDKYINKFELEFSKSKTELNEILQNLPSEQRKMFDLILKTAKEQTASMIEDDYNGMKEMFEAKGRTLSEAEYCKLYDDNAEEFIQTGKERLREVKPDLPLD